MIVNRQASTVVLALLFVGCLLVAVRSLYAQEDDMASTSAALAPRAERLILARCSVCHSSDLIAQQRLPRERWEATVGKMMQWGAELTKDEADLLVRYLSARYHPGAPDRLAPLDRERHESEPSRPEPAAEGPLIGVAARGADIFANNCQACHGTGAGGGMGPKLAKNPILKHEDLFWDTVLHGQGPMPAWGSELSHQDIADIYTWLSTK